MCQDNSCYAFFPPIFSKLTRKLAGFPCLAVCNVYLVQPLPNLTNAFCHYLVYRLPFEWIKQPTIIKYGFIPIALILFDSPQYQAHWLKGVNRPRVITMSDQVPFSLHDPEYVGVLDMSFKILAIDRR